MNTRDRLLAVSVAAMWGVNFIAIDFGLQHFPPLFLSALRYAVVAVPAMLFVPWPQVAWKWLIGYGLGFGTLQFAFLFVAIDVGMPTGLASLVLQASAPFTVLLGGMLLRERITPIQACGISMAVLGMAVIGWHRSQTAALLPVLLTLCGALGWAFGNLCNRRAEPSNPLHLTLWMSVVPPLPLFTLSALLEGPSTGWRALVGAFTSTQGLLALAGLAYIVLVATVLAAGIWTALMRRNPAGMVAPFSLLVPVVGFTAAWLVLDERPDVVEIAAGVVVVAGVLLGSAATRGTATGDTRGERNFHSHRAGKSSAHSP
ncbi:O-acetylserine/cysteine efflux transporter [Halopolyspora algeriensis]|uniref:O-acetylserine/cysteine efflux transporter n=1 Tax=Halopolyspora algeriensis TaxID=1500506 RepID=A0A368VBE5_9ACTN|nr:EamA family transporter [Halopolyspora algeriensis]RCW37640.1 O-acetylserine/cysteine efflux transporter [Halopolyspora algeriensis]TQM46235.1 O-acetylserine/cysteine efflux transporter [Halopolyspora algeriensis]